MSSKIELQRICQHCYKEFTAKTTVTRYCSHRCASAAYKQKIRTGKVEESKKQTQRIKNQPIEELKAKAFLSIADTCKLIGISRRTVYRMIERGELIFGKAGKRTIIRRSDIEHVLFEQTRTVQPQTKKEPQPVTEFYTVREIEKKYSIKYGRLNTIIKENNIPKTVHNGMIHVSKPHIDRYFKRTRDDVSHITEWYTMQEIQEKYNISRDQVYYKVSVNKLPKMRKGKQVKISKQHFDELFEIGL